MMTFVYIILSLSQLTELSKIACMWKIKPGFRRRTIIDLKQSKYENWNTTTGK